MNLHVSDKSDEQAQKDTLFQRVWRDEAFARALDADPRTALAEYGYALPKDLDIRVVRDTAALKHLHIPVAPVEAEVTEAELMGVQGGTSPVCVTAVATLTIMIGSMTYSIAKD
ncbi:nitrile hydratase subunit alpha [Ruegeria sp. 2205SS24-7]|uniref:nitrile hydratase subunit alpha n=1 Tax=Ruegeria discodermiae TaxID=3064389 RepID=UPI002741D921|nr:nitrile hydratase subunit alpha [Ruegeria sp. 2205SS24-7]MDP5215728.1 nitrile hydratase subunit alpha [Ruegeria sp. 2205SS24-7]